ncbi:MAG TPA: type II toxin-antitoxin system HicB family antitoxin [Thermomicrobiaceae bacterium]|nr:type II toxin-antitoxin system HicB family antitoxin [Thermomicrobiaceae bacterium]
MTVKRRYSAVITKEDHWYVAQCLEVDVASQGESEAEALANLREALELYFESPLPTAPPHIAELEIEIGAA